MFGKYWLFKNQILEVYFFKFVIVVLELGLQTTSRGGPVVSFGTHALEIYQCSTFVVAR